VSIDFEQGHVEQTRRALPALPARPQRAVVCHNRPGCALPGQAGGDPLGDGPLAVRWVAEQQV